MDASSRRGSKQVEVNKLIWGTIAYSERVGRYARREKPARSRPSRGTRRISTTRPEDDRTSVMPDQAVPDTPSSFQGFPKDRVRYCSTVWRSEAKGVQAPCSSVTDKAGNGRVVTFDFFSPCV